METKSTKPPTTQEEEIDLQKIMHQLLRHWVWFVVFGSLGLAGAMGYSRLTSPDYQVISLLLVPQKSNGMDLKNLFNMDMEQTYTEIYNQIEILRSSFTIRKTLANLNWRTSWYEQELLVWKGRYKQAPFEVVEQVAGSNPAGIRLYVRLRGANGFILSAQGTIEWQGKAIPVDFESEGEFGIPFKNEFFHFTLLPKGAKEKEDPRPYYFVFNQLSQLTRAYQQRLEVNLKDKFCDIVICAITGPEPDKEADFLNELTQVYIRQKMDFQNEAQRRSLEFLDAQLSGISDSLSLSGDKYTAFRSQNEIIDLGSEGTMVMNHLREIENEKAKSQVQLDYFGNLLSYLEQSIDLTQLVSPSVVGIEDVSLNGLVVKLNELYNRRQTLSFTARETNPNLVMLNNELKETRRRLNENLRNLIANATQSIKSLNARQSKISARLNKLPEKEQKMINIERQYNLTNDIYTFLLEKRAETNIALASSISDIQVIEQASRETASPKGLSGRMVMALGLLLGMSLPGGSIALVNLFDNRILSQEDVEEHTQLPIVGNITHSTDGSELTVHTHPKSNIAESFRELRTNLQFMLSGPGAQVISLHSTNPGEGKSYNSVNLGSILAMNEHRVLLIGADMRKPKLHKVFNVDNHHGLSTCLICQDSFEQVIVKTGIENLWLLPSGPIPPNPAEILSKPAMRQLLEWARNRFDYIILDNAPVAMVTDGMIAGRLSDLNIFILRFGMSHKHQLEMINHYAETKKVNDIAIIVNDIKANKFGTGYYKYYQDELFKKSYYMEEKKKNAI